MNCRAVALEECGPDSLFRFMPIFRAQTEGSPVSYENALKIESKLLPDNYIHQSLGHEMYKLTGEQMTNAPKWLRRGKTYEMNLSTDSCALTIQQYARFSYKDSRSLVTGK